jgi:hypothetical protein
MSALQGLPVKLVCGIYGYHIISPIDLPDLGLRIEPVTSNYDDVSDWVREGYRLTAILIGESIPRHVLFKLEAILAFIENRDVLITPAVEQVNKADLFGQFFTILEERLRGTVSFAVIHQLKSASRTSFIIKAFDRFKIEAEALEIKSKEKDDDLNGKALFNALFFKYVETFRQQNMFRDLQYYYLFSGLEAFAMDWAKGEGLLNPDPKKPFCTTCGYLIPKKELKKCDDCVNLLQEKPSYKSASYVIYRFLNKDGDVFGATDNIKSGDDNNKYKAMCAYAALRNKLVHEHKLRTFIEVDKTPVQLYLLDFLPRLKELVQLVILKEVGFVDEVDFNGADRDYKGWFC